MFSYFCLNKNYNIDKYYLLVDNERSLNLYDRNKGYPYGNVFFNYDM